MQVGCVSTSDQDIIMHLNFTYWLSWAPRSTTPLTLFTYSSSKVCCASITRKQQHEDYISSTRGFGPSGRGHKQNSCVKTVKICTCKCDKRSFNKIIRLWLAFWPWNHQRAKSALLRKHNRDENKRMKFLEVKRNRITIKDVSHSSVRARVCACVCVWVVGG